MWKHISCPHILKFNGAFYHDGVPAIIMPWMPHGNIAEYLEIHTGADRLRLVSLNSPASRCASSYRASSPCSFLVWSKESGTSTITT